MEWLGDHQWAVWLAIAIGLGIGEMLSLDLILGMLALGAMAGLVAAVAGAPEVAQALIAAGTSLATLALLRPPLIRRLHGGPDLKQGHQRLLGEHGRVLREITPHSPGLIKVAGEEWTAAPYDPTTMIADGAVVEVMEIRGATAYVYEVPQLEV